MAMIQAFASAGQHNAFQDTLAQRTSDISVSNLSEISDTTSTTTRTTESSSLDQPTTSAATSSTYLSAHRLNGSKSRRSSNKQRRESNVSNISVRDVFAQAHDPTSPLSTEGIMPTMTKNQQDRQVKTFTDGLLKTSMHLINEKDKYLQDVENMLLPLLDSLLSSGVAGPYQQQLVGAHQWALSQFLGGGVSLPGASRYDVRLCGWLGKLGRNGTKIQKRWIELSGQTLSYFADEKNGLELRGCLDLEGCVCRPLPPTKSGICSFELRSGGRKGSVIKKVNNSAKKGKYKEKTHYKFSVGDQDDLTMWTVAIQEAINQPELRRVKQTVGALQKIYDIRDEDDRVNQYVKKIRSMEGDRWLRFPSDWLHQQVLMKTARQTGKTVEGPVVDDRHQAKDLAQVYKDVVRDTVVIDGRSYVCANGDVIIQALFISIYDMFCEQHGMNGHDGPDERSDSNVTFDATFNVERDHFITKNALAYTRAVLLASCRTVSGGDTYDAVDFMLRNEEISVICPDSEFSAPVAIAVFYPDLDSEYSSNYNGNGTNEYQEASNTTWTTTTLRTENEEKQKRTTRKTAPPLISSNLVKASSTPNISTSAKNGQHLRSSTTQVESSSNMKRTDSGRQSKLQGLRARFRSPKGGDGNSTDDLVKGGDGFSHVGFRSVKDSMEMLPEEQELLEAMSWPTVRVDVESRYRVMDSDPMSGRSDDPLIARVQTTFTRSFAWGRHTYCKPAEVLVKILPSEVEEDEEDEDGVEDGEGVELNALERELSVVQVF